MIYTTGCSEHCPLYISNVGSAFSVDNILLSNNLQISNWCAIQVQKEQKSFPGAYGKGW